ncbi:MAG: sulfatase-like hydrolase/transferase, partial [Calditrichaeota bacterium]|nr:sulfatase-like hydrolase/transferase [Calditrichota bacterium]
NILNMKSNFDQGFNFYYAGEAPFNDFFWGLIYSKIFNENQTKNIKTKLRLNEYRLSSEINKIALYWVEKNITSPFFLFINYMEPHEGFSYLPKSYNKLSVADWGKWVAVISETDRDEIIHKRKTITNEQRQALIDWYDCRLAYLDYNIGQFFQTLKRLNLYDNSLIIVVADHGEMMGEHNSFGHLTELYNELIKVPLIIKYPESLKFRNIKDKYKDKYVQTVDLMPEVLQVLNIPLPDEIQGQPIEKADHQIIAELFRSKYIKDTKLNPERYYRDLKAAFYKAKKEDFKYIQSSNLKSEFYNLTIDPFEANNLISKKSSEVASLDRQLEGWRKSFKLIKRIEKKRKKISKELEKRLKTLGYIK